jgi:hypothetical protein
VTLKIESVADRSVFRRAILTRSNLTPFELAMLPVPGAAPLPNHAAELSPESLNRLRDASKH